MPAIPLPRLGALEPRLRALAARLRPLPAAEAATDPAEAGEDGRAAPAPALVLAVAAACLMAGVGLIWLGAAAPGLVLLLAALAALAGLHPAAAVEWTEDGIAGPAPGRPWRTLIHWEAAESLRRVAPGIYLMTDGRGRRLWWTAAHRGHDHLMCRIAEECPWLFPDAPQSPA